MLIRLGYDSESWQQGIKKEIIWNPEKCPHLLISGHTGGGKSVLSQLIVNQLLSDTSNSICICDFKAGGDWDNILSDYSEYVSCDIAFNRYYEAFCETIRNKQKKNNYLIFDEFSSYALSKDSKEFKELMSKVSHLAFMGRSFGFHLILISQQFNAKVLDTAIREQFGTRIYMGSQISQENATMLFPGTAIDKNVRLRNHCGYISTLENEISIIQIPYISKVATLKQLLEKKGKIYESHKNCDC